MSEHTPNRYNPDVADQNAKVAALTKAVDHAIKTANGQLSHIVAALVIKFGDGLDLKITQEDWDAACGYFVELRQGKSIEDGLTLRAHPPEATQEPPPEIIAGEDGFLL